MMNLQKVKINSMYLIGTVTYPNINPEYENYNVTQQVWSPAKLSVSSYIEYEDA